MTDLSGVKTTYTLDAFGRVKLEELFSQGNGEPFVKNRYAYPDTQGEGPELSITYGEGSEDAYTVTQFYNGLGRLIRV